MWAAEGAAAAIMGAEVEVLALRLGGSRSEVRGRRCTTTCHLRLRFEIHVRVFRSLMLETRNAVFGYQCLIQHCSIRACVYCTQ